MLEFTPGFFAIALPAVIFAGISKAGFGSGAAFASSSILAIVLPPGVALGIMLPLLMLVDVASLGPYWKRWSWPESRALMLGALPGVALGAALYKVTDDDAIRLLIGLISIGFVAWQISVKRGWIRLGGRPLPVRGGYLAGLVAGFTSFVSHAGGPPAAVYLLGRQLDKTTYQASSVLVFWAINLFKAVPYSFLGIFTVQTLLADLILAPAALIGTWLGIKAHHRIPERAFFALAYVLLTCTGVKLVWDALS
ncbi:MAG: sulfite exporter TauE/SafE family protein [Rhodobacteraceae bacterium]|nr:MAG: sulfite exporter TauE/SafE family protein [Paracoccaceae bacterium]